MAPTCALPHASAVGYPRDGRGRGGGQTGLPGLDVDEFLPSEQALTGEVLADRRHAALLAFRDALGPCPEGFTDEEWRVSVAHLAPESALGAQGKAARARQARQCFPGYTVPAALQAWLETSQRPHVQEFIRTFRAHEALDVLAQREQVREVLTEVMLLGMGVLDLRAVDPTGAAKCGAAAAAAAKVLMDLDGLRAAKPEAIGGEATPAGNVTAKGLPAEDPLEALARKVALVAEDVQRRRGDADGGVLG